MIIIKIQGGLGNQMFQYALGRSIQENTNKEAKFDLSWFKQFPQRKYTLDRFKTEIKSVSFFEMIRVRKFERRDGRRYLLFNFLRKKGSLHIKEKGYIFQPEILNLKKDTYLDGNWQSYKYFKNIKNKILKELTLAEKPCKEFDKIKEKIKETNSISIHIRRGDYTTKKVQRILKLCSLDYYDKAISIIKNRVDNPIFFIFSDDINWVQKNIKTNLNTIFVSDGKLKDYEELILMSKCKHNIIANSSFSWWGAWLNNNPNKIVTVPEKWFKNEKMNTQDLTPESWSRI